MQPSAELLSSPELVARILKGDPEAEAQLYEMFSARVYFTALTETHSKEDAEDVRAETFLRVIQALRQDKLRSADSLPSFIVGITLNVIRELLRQKYRVDSLEDYQYDIASEGSHESVFLDEETRRSIADLAKYLKPRDRDFLRMFYYEERPKEDIARVLGVREEQLRLIKARALKRFREVYEKLRLK